MKRTTSRPARPGGRARRYEHGENSLAHLVESGDGNRSIKSSAVSVLLSLTLIAGFSLQFQGSSVQAEEAEVTPKAIPLTRPAMKCALDRLKFRSPRLPLPPREEGERGVNNGRMRNQYLSESMRPTGSGRREDPSMSLDYRFATMLFWVTSRVNNCHYCLGHQEQKLQAVGVEDDTLAQLDCDWSQFSPAEQAAFAFTQKLTYHPDQIHTEDLERLQQHFSNLQVLEIVFHVARYNATNRWTDSLGIPQEAYRVFETETSEPYQAVVSTTAFSGEPASEVSAAAVVASRTTPNDLAEIRRQISDGLKHQSRLPLVSSDECRELLNLPADQDPKNWERLLANFPVRGVDAIAAEHACMTGGAVPERLKAQMAFVAAREDRAWYALAQSLDRLAAAGASPNEIAELLTLEELPEGAERDVLLFCRKLTSAPQQIVDADIAGLREHFDDSTVAEIVYLSTQAAFFDRLTLATDLPVEDEVAKSALALLAPADSVK